MNPSSAGIAAIVFNYDDGVFASDEARMLAEMGDMTFRLDNVLESSYEDVFLSDSLLKALEESFILSVPMCSECAFEPNCGADPVYAYAVHGDITQAVVRFLLSQYGYIPSAHFNDGIGPGNEKHLPELGGAMLKLSGKVVPIIPIQELEPHNQSNDRTCLW